MAHTTEPSHTVLLIGDGPYAAALGQTVEVARQNALVCDPDHDENVASAKALHLALTGEEAAPRKAGKYSEFSK